MSSDALDESAFDVLSGDEVPQVRCYEQYRDRVCHHTLCLIQDLHLFQTIRFKSFAECLIDSCCGEYRFQNLALVLLLRGQNECQHRRTDVFRSMFTRAHKSELLVYTLFLRIFASLTENFDDRRSRPSAAKISFTR